MVYSRGKILTHDINQMKLFNVIAAAAVIGSALLGSAVSVNAQSYYGRTKPTFSNPSGRSYTTWQNPNYNSFSGTRNSYKSNGFHGNCTSSTCRRYN
jgi:hypothetical protein